MEPSEIAAKLRQSVGHTVTIVFDGHTETMFVVLANIDGFLCRLQSAAAQGPIEEVWIAYQDVSEIVEVK